MLQYVKAFLDATDPSASLKHLAFAAGMGFSLLWLSYELCVHGMSVNWIAAYTIFVGAITTTKIVGGKDNDPRGSKAD